MKPLARSLRLLAVAFTAAVLGSCAEKLDSSGVCSILCPPIGGEVQNVTLDAAVVFDTAVQSLSGLGAEEGLLLAARGDTLDARVIVRFDSLPTTYVLGADPARPITEVDSVSLRLLLDTLATKGNAAITIEAYDLSATPNDTSTAEVLAMFTPDRLIASHPFPRSQLRDTLVFPLPNAHLLAKIQGGQGMRLGLRSTSDASTQILILSHNSAQPPVLRFRVSADTAIRPIVVNPLSKTPAGDVVAASNLSDYTVFARRPPPGNATDLDIGGYPPRRGYLRFDIPSRILDSSTVIRATILLDQIANPLLDPTDSVLIVPQLVLAGASVADPTKAAQIITDFSTDTLRFRPGESGQKLVEIGRAFGVWRGVKPSDMPHAIVLKSTTEGRSPLEIRFSSLEAAPAQRPRLRISYTNDVPLGLP